MIELTTQCPYCGVVNPLVSPSHGPGSDTPERGSFSFCIECGGWGVFDAVPNRNVLTLRRPTTNELNELAKFHDLRRWHVAWLLASNGIRLEPKK